MPASTDLTTATLVKTHLGISGTSDDTFIGTLIDAVSEWIENETGRLFGYAARTEYQDGDDGKSTIFLRNYPVASSPAPAVYYDTTRAFGAATQIDADDVILNADAGIIDLDGVECSEGRQSIKIVYTAGYSTIPNDLALAATQLVAAVYHKAKQGGEGISSETFAGASAVWDPDAIPAPIKRIINKYRRLSL